MEDDLPVSANSLYFESSTTFYVASPNLMRRSSFIAIAGHRGVWPSDEAVGSAVPDTDVELASILRIYL